MSGLAIVEKKPPLNGGGSAGGVLFHLLDWHRRLARKRRIFSPRWLLPASLRSAPRRLPARPPSPPPLQPPPAPNLAAADGSAPGVVARLMGLESWPGSAGGSPGKPRPQKQRKVEPSPPPDSDSAVVLVLPTSRRPPPAPVAVPAPRSHHGSDLPARSPRRTRLVHAAAAKLLEPGARASSRAGARLALAYACSSPQHRKDDSHSGALLQGSGTADDFLSRSGSTSMERSTRFQPLPAPPAEARRDSAEVSRRHEYYSVNSGDAVTGATPVVLPRMDFGVANMSKSGSSDVDAAPVERRVRNEGTNTGSKVRSSGSSVRAGDERLRKRGTPNRPEVSASVNPVSLASSTSQFGHARESMSAGKRVAHSSSGPRREFMGSATGQGNTNRRDVINRSGLASTSRISGNGPGQKRVSRKNVGRVVAASNTDDRNAVALASRPSVKQVTRASSHSNVSKSGRPSRRASNTACARMPAADPKCIEASASAMATSEKDEFSRLLKAKVNELGMSDRIEFASSDPLSGKLNVLQELISALTNDMNTSISQSSNRSYASAPLHSSGNVGCIDQSGYAFSDNRSPDFQKCYEGEQDVDSPAASINNEPNQPSPVSVLEGCFSNDTSSGSPVEKNEDKERLLSMEKEHKIEDLFNLESDIVYFAKSIDPTKASDGILSCFENFVAHDFKILQSRLHSIGEALSNVELLLGRDLMHGATSALELHPFIMEMLETSAGVFREEESLGLTEEKYYQHTNFLFDCIVESLDSKFHDFGKCGYKAWLKLPLSLSKDLLKQELLEVISNWKESGAALSRVADKELDQVTSSWDGCSVQVFDISVAVEDDILEALVVELALDLW